MTVAQQTIQAESADSLVQLEFAKVVALVVGRTQTPYGRDLAGGLAPSGERQRISAALEEAAEAGRMLEEAGPLSLGSGIDLRPHLERLRTEGVRLSPEILCEVQAALATALACRRQLLGLDSCPGLQAHGRSLVPLPELEEQIGRCIGERGEILDSASGELAGLRGDLKTERNRIKRLLERLLQEESLQGVFQETLITDRNGRYVLPVRADHSGRLKGFVHDVSASGQTLYLEPAAALDGNNRVQTLIRRIEREEERILAWLTAAVREVRETLADNQAILAHLDLRQAIARLGRDLDACVPVLADGPCLDLRDARHPLLVMAQRAAVDGEPVVPIDVRLPQDREALIISGPNTGGKTVALKTAGLLILMVRAGLPIPCSPGSRLFPFAPVMADIGDEQSIEHSLSTFSGHLLRLRRILERADEETLVLMDELGTGTDPGEGSALALAALDVLRLAGARVMATTHLHIVKGYAQLEAAVENAAVEFDAETLRPTFRLHYGIPGASHAFTIARRIGLPESVLAGAADYLGLGEREGVAIIERLQELRNALEDDLSATRQARREADQERASQRRLREELENSRRALLEETRQQGARLLASAEERLQRLFARVPAGTVTPKERSELTRALRTLKDELPAAVTRGPEQPAGRVDAGEILFVPALGVEAEVVRVDGDRAELMAGGKKLRQPLKALRQYQPRRFAAVGRPEPKVRDRVTRNAFRPRLLLVGKRVEEARDLLDRFLDDALLHGELQLEVVHGAGQGILRRVVREYLADRAEVATFHAAGAEQGGDNVTLVEIRH